MRRASDLPDRLRLPVNFDTTQLKSDLEKLTQNAWIDHFLTDRYLGNWDVIPLRGPEDAQHPIMMIAATSQAKSFKNVPALEACEYFRNVIASFESNVYNVRLMRLTPGSVLKEHTDHEYMEEDGVFRVHVPVVTNPDVYFMLNGTRVVMEAGSAWYLRLSDPHSVTNAGTTDRVHMLIDIALNDRLRAMLMNAARSTNSHAP